MTFKKNDVVRVKSTGEIRVVGNTPDTDLSYDPMLTLSPPGKPDICRWEHQDKVEKLTPNATSPHCVFMYNECIAVGPQVPQPYLGEKFYVTAISHQYSSPGGMKTTVKVLRPPQKGKEDGVRLEFPINQFHFLDKVVGTNRERNDIKNRLFAEAYGAPASVFRKAVSSGGEETDVISIDDVKKAIDAWKSVNTMSLDTETKLEAIAGVNFPTREEHQAELLVQMQEGFSGIYPEGGHTVTTNTAGDYEEAKKIFCTEAPGDYEPPAAISFGGVIPRHTEDMEQEQEQDQRPYHPDFKPGMVVMDTTDDEIHVVLPEEEQKDPDLVAVATAEIDPEEQEWYDIRPENLQILEPIDRDPKPGDHVVVLHDDTPGFDNRLTGATGEVVSKTNGITKLCRVHLDRPFNKYSVFQREDRCSGMLFSKDNLALLPEGEAHERQEKKPSELLAKLRVPGRVFGTLSAKKLQQDCERAMEAFTGPAKELSRGMKILGEAMEKVSNATGFSKESLMDAAERFVVEDRPNNRTKKCSHHGHLNFSTVTGLVRCAKCDAQFKDPELTSRDDSLWTTYRKVHAIIPGPSQAAIDRDRHRPQCHQEYNHYGHRPEGFLVTLLHQRPYGTVQGTRVLMPATDKDRMYTSPTDKAGFSIF